MSKAFHPWNPEHLLLLTPAPVDCLAEMHLVFFLLHLVAELDLEQIRVYCRQKAAPREEVLRHADDGTAAPVHLMSGSAQRPQNREGLMGGPVRAAVAGDRASAFGCGERSIHQRGVAA